MNFKKFLHTIKEQNTVGKHNDFASAAFLSTNQSGSEAPDNLQGRGLHLPSTDAIFPTPTNTGVIKSLGNTNDNGEPTQNPIPVTLSDNTRLSLTWKQFNRIGRPQKGWTVTVRFLRAPDDRTGEISGIHSIETRDPDSGETFKYYNWQ